MDLPLILCQSHVLYHVGIAWTVFSREFLQMSFNSAKVPLKQTVIAHVDTGQGRQNPAHPSPLGGPCQPLKHNGNDGLVQRFSNTEILCAIFGANVLRRHATDDCGSCFNVPLNLSLQGVTVVRRVTCCVTFVCVTHVRPALETVAL